MGRKRNILFVVTVVMLVQVLLLDALQLTSVVIPMPYVICILLLPMGMTQLQLMAVALAIGITEDLSMGTMGLNTAALLPMAYFRNTVLTHMIQYHGRYTESSIPSGRLMGKSAFNAYVIVSVAAHNVLFFAIEWMSFDSFAFFLSRLAASTAVTVALAYAFMLLLRRHLRE